MQINYVKSNSNTVHDFPISRSYITRAYIVYVYTKKAEIVIKRPDRCTLIITPL